MVDFKGHVVLVNPPMAVSDGYPIAPPLGLLVASPILEERGAERVSVIDFTLDVMENELPRNGELVHLCAERLGRMDASVYGFSVQCFNLPVALAIAHSLNTLRPDVPIAFGGHQASLLGRELDRRFPFVHSVDARAFAGNQEWPIPDYRKLVGMDRYVRTGWPALGLVELGRGCPFGCSFCSIPTVFPGRHKYKPIGLVLKELQCLVEMGYRQIHFIDNNFALDGGYARSLIAELRANRTRVDWSVMTRLDLVSPELLHSMREAGCESVLYGIESADDDTLRAVQKRYTSCRSPSEVLRWHTDVGVQARFYFLVNLPVDTRQGMDNTLRTASRLSVIDPGVCHFQLPRFAPRTRLTEAVRSQLVPNVETPYANTLCQTLGDDVDVAWRYVTNRTELCSTYCTAPGPLSDAAADALSWLGTELFASLPMTMAILGEEGRLIDLFDYLGHQCRGRLWLKLGQQKAELVRAFVGSHAPEYSEVALFEVWLSDCLSYRRESTEQQAMISRVDLSAARQAATDGAPVHRHVFGPQRLYRVKARDVVSV